jgi:hypothetical protein
MPFPFIPTALGISFFLMWALIGGMILRDGQLAAQRERELERPFPQLSSRGRRTRAA